MTAIRGYIKLDKELINSYNRTTGKCGKTFNNNLKKLFKRKWITKNSKKGELHIKSYNSVLKKTHCYDEHISGALWNNTYFKHFSSFVYAAIITKHGKTLKWRNRASETNKGGLFRRGSQPYLILPYTYLSKSLNIGKSQAQKMFLQATNAGFIKIEHSYEKLSIPIQEINSLRSCQLTDHEKIRIINGTPRIQHSNHFYSSIEIKRKRIKKKSIPYIRDIIKGM